MKKRNKFISFFTALFVGLSCLFTACNSKTNFSLRFMVDDTVYATVSTAGNEVIQMPKDPAKEDYIFEGWYWDKDLWRNQFTARSLLDTPLSSNMEVYAHFVDESYLKGTDINIKTADKVNIEGIGDVFYLRVRNNQMVCKFNDYVEINPHSSWTLSTDIAGNNTIASKTVELSVGDNPLYYIYVTDKDNFHETYIVLVHRNYMFTVSFNSNGGSSCSSQQVEEGYYLENIPTTTRKGHTFDRWNYDFKNEPIKSNVTAKAIWTANNYKITYNPNGGSVSSETQTVTFDEHYTLATPTRLGYSFKGWKTSSGSYFANSGTWTLDQNITLTADWEIIYYSLTYELNGGSSSSIVLKSSYTVEDSFTIPSLLRTGYTFKGWSLSSSLTNAKIDYSVEKGTTGNLKFYAKWEANTYTVTYDVNGGDILDEDTQTVTYGENTTLANPTREGYDFAGWYNGSSKVNNGDWNIANDVTLTARWEATEYAIKYDLNGGTNSSNNPLKYTIESETIVLEDATREGYTFKGWTTDKIAEPTFGLTIPHGSTGEKQFTANWEANTYTVTYDVNGGNAIEDNVKEYVYDSDVTLLTPTRSGYNFAGWYYGTQLVDSGIWKIADNVTLVARWSREEFNIQYQLNNGNNDPSNPASYNYDSETITLADASRVGYTFLGWTSSDIQNPTKGVQIVHNSVGDKLFIANWQANTYTVTYDVNGGNSIGKTSEEIVFDEVLTLINPTRTGYTFSGWYSGNTLYESGVWKTAKDVNLVARWTPNNYTITKENGSGAGTSVVTYDDNYNLGTSSKDGYEFVGWYTEMYGQGTQYADENGNSLNPYIDANDQTLYASFIYHITFVSNGGSYVPTLTLHENECLSDTIVTEKENRTFAGWFTDPQLTKPVSYSQPLGNITLYAKWAEEVQPTQLTYTYVSTTKLTIQGMSYSGTSVILPSHIGGEPVAAIASQAFKNMNFTSLEIPETVTNIGEGAFQGCNSLNNLIIPFVGSAANKSGTYDSVFGWIFGSSTSFQSGWTRQYYNGVGDGSRYYNIPSTLRNVTVTVQTAFGKGAFYGCSNLVDIKIPTNTKTIGEAAFYGCTSLKRLNSEEDGVFNIPSGVTTISPYAFYSCKGATKINLSNNVITIGNYAFADCVNVKQFNSSTDGHLVVPSSCQSVGSYAFRGMNSMTDVIIPESVTYIGEGALYGFTSLENLTIPFVGSAANKSGTYDSVFGWIFGSSTSSQSGWTRQYYNGVGNGSRYYNIPSTLRNVTVTVQTAFGKGAFYGCSNLTNVYLLKDSDTSANGCFTNCTAEIHKVLDESATAPWNGSSISSGFSGGSGTENDPYVINSAADLAYLAQEVNNGNSFEGIYFVLGNDINLNGHPIIIGDSALHPFKGTINGNGHVIRNLTINSTDTYAGLFGYFSGTIYNVGFEAVSIKTNSTEESVYAGIFGYVSSSGIIHDVYATGSITATGQTYVYAGGLVGYCEGTIYNSYSKCNVTCTSSGYMAFAGGLVGYLNSGTLSNSFATGNVSAKGATTNYSRNGGLVGINNGGTIENCYKSSSQTLTRNGTSGSAYNEEGTTVSFENVTGNMIIEGLGWDSNIWSGSEDFPILKQ